MPAVALQRGRAHVSAESLSAHTNPASSTTRLQRGRAHLSAESALLLLPLAQVRNALIATAGIFLRARLFILSDCLALLVWFEAFMACERRRDFLHHPAARMLNCQRSGTSQTT